MIKICNNLAGRINIVETSTGHSLWEGKSGSTAVFHIDKPEEISISWGLNKNKINKKCTSTVKAGEKWELAWTQGLLRSDVLLRRVDIIDAGH